MSTSSASEPSGAAPLVDRDGPAGFERAVLHLLEGVAELLPSRLAPLVVEAAALLGSTSTEVLIVDDDQQTLVPLVDDQAEPQAVDGSAAGQAFRRSELVRHDSDDGAMLWLPLLDGTSRVGVLAVLVPPPTSDLVRRIGAFAALVSGLVVTRSAYTDVFTVARRQQPMTLEAELAWSILPPLTFRSEEVSVAGILKPAYEVAGDAFDYAIDDGVAHVALVDAMGHGLEASRMSSVAIAAYRNQRRRGADLRATFDAIDDVIATQFGDQRYVTGQFARLDLTSGRLSWLNAGHPRPLHVRDDTVLGQLECPPTAPAGWRGRRGPVAEIDLQPGDSVLFFTDGVVDARSPEGAAFTAERLGDHLVRSTIARLSTAETVRRLSHDVLAHQGADLDDDATMMLVRWGRRS